MAELRHGPALASAAATAAADALTRLFDGPTSGSLECRSLDLDTLVAEALHNVAFSAAAGALGDGLDGIVFPTVPRLSGELAQEFAVPPAEVGRRVRTIWSARSEPLDRGGRLSLTFLWQPGSSNRRTIGGRPLS